jgi:hypothetical protein
MEPRAGFDPNEKRQMSWLAYLGSVHTPEKTLSCCRKATYVHAQTWQVLRSGTSPVTGL